MPVQPSLPDRAAPTWDCLLVRRLERQYGAYPLPAEHHSHAEFGPAAPDLVASPGGCTRNGRRELRRHARVVDLVGRDLGSASGPRHDHRNPDSRRAPRRPCGLLALALFRLAERRVPSLPATASGSCVAVRITASKSSLGTTSQVQLPRCSPRSTSRPCSSSGRGAAPGIDSRTAPERHGAVLFRRAPTARLPAKLPARPPSIFPASRQPWLLPRQQVPQNSAICASSTDASARAIRSSSQPSATAARSASDRRYIASRPNIRLR